MRSSPCPQPRRLFNGLGAGVGRAERRSPFCSSSLSFSVLFSWRDAPAAELSLEPKPNSNPKSTPGSSPVSFPSCFVGQHRQAGAQTPRPGLWVPVVTTAAPSADAQRPGSAGSSAPGLSLLSLFTSHQTHPTTAQHLSRAVPSPCGLVMGQICSSYTQNRPTLTPDTTPTHTPKQNLRKLV